MARKAASVHATVGGPSASAGSHLVVVGAQHELLMEQDRYRAQFWAAFDAFVPGTALY